MKKFIWFMVVITSLFFCNTVFAVPSDYITDIDVTNSTGENETVVDSDGNVDIVFTIGSSVSSSLIYSFMVIPSLISVEELRNSLDTSKIVHYDEGLANSECKIYYNANMGDFPNGEYTIVIGYYSKNDTNNYITKNFIYENPTNLTPEEVAVATAVNDAITSNSQTKMLAILGDETKINALPNVAYTDISSLNASQIGRLATRLLANSVFETDGKLIYDNINDIAFSVKSELAVALLDNEDSVAAVTYALEQYNTDFYKLDLENETYIKYPSAVLNRMISVAAGDLDDVKDSYLSAIYISAMEKASYHDIYTMIKGWINTLPDAKIPSVKDTDAFGKALKAKLSALNTLTDIANFINNYSETSGSNLPENHRKSSSGGGSFEITGATSTVIPAAESSKRLYRDISEEHYAYEAVGYLSAKKIINGYEDGNFCGENGITRAEFINLLVNAFEIPTDTEFENAFTDISEKDWFYPYIIGAVQKGIVKGDTDKRMNPNATITRQEMASMLCRTMENAGIEPAYNTNTTAFLDNTEIAEWAYSSIIKLSSTGIVSGVDDGRFGPNETANRYQAAVIIFRAVTANTEVNE